MPALAVHNLTKTFRVGPDSVHALADASLSVEPREFLSIQGPSGCGKSTLLLIAGALLAPTSGTVTINGTSLYDLSPGQRASFRAKNIGFVFQRFHLVPYLSVLDNVLAPTLAADLELPDAPQRAAALLERFAMTHRLRHRPDQLSTGERQRVALARALLANPKLILADEPTGNLDAKNAQLVLHALAESAQNGAAVLLVTHDPEASAHATRTLRLKHGRLDPSTAAPTPSPTA